MFDLFDNGQLPAILLLLAVIVFQKRLGALFNLAKVRLRSANWSPAARGEAPPHTAHLLAGAGVGLRALGFEPAGALSAEPMIAVDPRRRVFADLYWNPAAAVLARVELATAQSGQGARVDFMTFFADGGLLLTVNRDRWAQMPAPEKVQVVDVYADDLAGQWQAHLEAMAAESARRTPLTDRAEALRRHTTFGVPRWIERMRQLKWVTEAGAGIYRFTPLGAWRYAGQLASPPPVARTRLAVPYRAEPAPAATARSLAEMDSVAANIALASQPLPAWLKTTLFVLTLAVSALLFGRGAGMSAAAALLAVLLVHELGHFTAMWAFGYRNLSIFFVPLLGAAAVGHKPHASAWQEAIVLFAGPVPGLVLAGLLTLIPAEALTPSWLEFTRAFVQFGVFINLFNLLPFGVLDGGRLFELAVLGRFPRARAVFAGAGALLGILYGVLSGSLLFAIAMTTVLYTVPLQFKAARAIVAIRHRAKKAGRARFTGEQALRALGREFAQPGFQRAGVRAFTHRLTVARLAYPRLLQGVPGLGVTVGVLAAMVAAWMLPAAWAVWSWQRFDAPLMRETAAEKQEEARRLAADPKHQAAVAAGQAFVAKFEAESDPERRWSLLEQHIDEEDDDSDDAHRYWMVTARKALIEQLPADHPGKLNEQLNKILIEQTDVPARITALIATLTHDGSRPPAEMDGERLKLLVNAWRSLAGAAPESMNGQGVQLDALWDALRRPGADVNTAARLAELRAHIAFSAGRIDLAGEWMERYRTVDDDASGLRARNYGAFLLDAGQYDRALALAQAALAQTPGPNPFLRQEWQTLAGWAEMQRSHPRAADRWFRAILTERAERDRASRASLPLAVRLITPDSDSATSLNAPVLDHLAALQGYDAQQAAQLAAELRKDRFAEPRARMITAADKTWGEARKKAHRRLVEEMGFTVADTRDAIE